MKTITDIINELKAEKVSVTRQSVYTLIKSKKLNHEAKPKSILLNEQTAQKIIEYYRMKKSGK